MLFIIIIKISLVAKKNYELNLIKKLVLCVQFCAAAFTWKHLVNV